MRTTPIQSGDIVLVDKRGDRFLAIVNAKTPDGLQIAPVGTAPRARPRFTATGRAVLTPRTSERRWPPKPPPRCE